jgi:diguanylate cyclase (GGDEF)-like protein
MKAQVHDSSERRASRAASLRHRWLAIEPAPRVTMALTLFGVVVVAVGDYLTGPYLVFATFYLIPVVVAAWCRGLRLALAIALCAVCSGVIGTAMHSEELSPPVYLWNETFRFVTYLFAAVTVSAVRNALRSIDAMASTDPLTGLLTRRRYHELAATEFARSRRSADPISLVYIDVDDLKQTNDRSGHDAGDRMLVAFAEAARSTLRSTDLLARLGGDEFSFLLPDTDRAAAHDTIQRLQQLLATEAVPVRFSAGIVSGTVTDDLDVESAIRAADLLMLEAKENGKTEVLSRPSLHDDMAPKPDPSRSRLGDFRPAAEAQSVDRP